MSELSPAAQAVWNAAYNTPEDCPYEHDLAAALRAAVEQVLPEVVNAVKDEHDNARRDQWVRIRCRFLAIVAELEAQ
jgi:hypothetical protein